jgi:hypothetical protein
VTLGPPDGVPGPCREDGGVPDLESGVDLESATGRDWEPGPYPVWSEYGPDGLLATVLAQVSDGPCGERVERIGGWERV